MSERLLRSKTTVDGPPRLLWVLLASEACLQHHWALAHLLTGVLWLVLQEEAIVPLLLVDRRGESVTQRGAVQLSVTGYEEEEAPPAGPQQVRRQGGNSSRREPAEVNHQPTRWLQLLLTECLLTHLLSLCWPSSSPCQQAGSTTTQVLLSCVLSHDDDATPDMDPGRWKLVLGEAELGLPVGGLRPMAMADKSALVAR